MIDKNNLLQSLPIAEYIRKNGFELKKDGKEQKCLCPFHADKNPSLRINEEKQRWFCDPCGFGGSIIDFEMRYKQVTFKQAIHALAEMAGIEDIQPKEYKRAARYVYKDQYGRPVMEVERHEAGDKKKFIQFTVDRNGKREPGISGVNRVLYKIDEWADKPEVSLCEGEKCVEALEKLGYNATTNAGGSNGWIDAYSIYLKDKHVDIWCDNDDSGQKWEDAVIKSLEGKVASLRTCRVSAPYNDVADMVASMGAEMATDAVISILERTPRIDRGVNIPLYSNVECYAKYKERVNRHDAICVDLSKWLPSFRSCARPLLPGDVGLVCCDTGVGKTTMLLNIAAAVKPLPTIFFELELTVEPLTERFIANEHSVDSLEVERATRRGESYGLKGWSHIYVSPISGLTLEQMRDIIMRAQLKMRDKPRLVLLDYVGLMQGKGNRRERLSDIAEGIKSLAIETETIIIIASQVKRDEDRAEIGLHDAKETGSLENSAQLVLGAWRPREDLLTIKILKQTKKSGQPIIECSFDGDKQQIKELSKMHMAKQTPLFGDRSEL